MTKKATPRLTTLLDKVERLCTNKAALARELGVTSTHIQKWVTAREYEPSGEVTLHLLEWVQAAEAQQTKNRGGASNTTTARTRKLNSLSHEKSSRVPKEK
jgi:uncharacterized protein (DUF2384 family)